MWLVVPLVGWFLWLVCLVFVVVVIIIVIVIIVVISPTKEMSEYPKGFLQYNELA